MQENLDVIISFVVIIIGVSMLLQIIMEMIKNGLKLRWDTYESFLLDVYRNEFFSSYLNFFRVAEANRKPPRDEQAQKSVATPEV